MPDGIRKGAQAVAMRISGDRASFYNCKFIGFQDTLCDDRGNHFFKDCYVEGTVDYIFGDGKSLYLVSICSSFVMMPVLAHLDNLCKLVYVYCRTQS